jgi:hypothetical protein
MRSKDVFSGLVVVVLLAILAAACSSAAAVPTATATPVPPTDTAVPPTATFTPAPPTNTPEPAIIIKLSPGKFGDPMWLDVIKGAYQIVGGTTLSKGSSIGVSEDWLMFPVGMVIQIGEKDITLKGVSYPAGTEWIVDASGNLVQKTP